MKADADIPAGYDNDGDKDVILPTNELHYGTFPFRLA